MGLDEKVNNIINEEPSLIRKTINFLKNKTLLVLLATTIGITSSYALIGWGKSKKSSGPATEFVDVDESKIIQDPDNGIYLLKDQLLIDFNNGVTDQEKQEIIKSVNGEIVAIDNDLGVYQVNTTVASLNDLYTKADTLELDSRVEFASPNYIDKVDKIPDILLLQVL